MTTTGRDKSVPQSTQKLSRGIFFCGFYFFFLVGSILEVKPHGISKGLTAEVIMSTLLRLNGRSEQQKAAAPFLLCIGDDKSDEEMFIVVQDREDKCLASPAYEGSLLTHRAEIIEDR